MSRVAVIGANGQLGSDLVATWREKGHEVIEVNHADVKIEDVDNVREVLGASRAEVVFNTAAFHHVPKCEADPELAYRVNGMGALAVARVAADLHIPNVYISTDYVFDGAKGHPYVESDRPNPLNVYASTKLLGEYYTLNYGSQGFVMRVSGIYGKIPCRAKGGNFITTMLRASRERPTVKVVTDEVLTPTPTAEIADASLRIVEKGVPGLYHVTSEGACSWFEFARVIFDELKLPTPLVPAKVSDFPSPVRRPYYSVLENQAMKSLGLPQMIGWEYSLRRFLRDNYASQV